MRLSSVTLGAIAIAALSCSRAPAVGAPAPGGAPVAQEIVSAGTMDSAIRRVPVTTISVQPIGPPGPASTTNARMEPNRIPPFELLRDSTFLLRVIVGVDGKAKLETMQLHEGATAEQRDASRRWLADATFVLPQRDGRSIEAPFQIMGRRGSRSVQSSRVSSAPGDVLPPAGAAEIPEEFALLMGRTPTLSPARITALAGRAARIASDIDTLRVRPGLTLTLRSTLRIAMIDSAGAVLGFLPIYDSELVGPVARHDGRVLTGVEEGVAELRLAWPRALWGDRTDAPPAVRIAVLNSSRVSDEELARQRPITGSGTSDCELARQRADCFFVEARRGDGRNEVRSIRIMVIQRGIPPRGRLRPMGDTARANASMRRMTAHRREVEDRGRTFIGTYSEELMPVGFELSRLMTDTVWVGDRFFVPPWRRDSALVVLLDHERPGSPVVGTVTIPSTLPGGSDTKTWTSGDTTFIVRPRETTPRWQPFFDRFPAIAQFLR